MRFKDFIKNNKIPDNLLKLLDNKKIRAINKAHRSGDLVYSIGNEYILKIRADYVFN